MELYLICLVVGFALGFGVREPCRGVVVRGYAVKGATNTDNEFQKAGASRKMSADTTSIGAARVFNPDIGGDISHRAYRRTGQIGVIRNLTIDTFTLTAQALTNAFQLANDAVDLIHRGARHTSDQGIGLTSLVGLPT
jgi:hypothetical protein